MPNINALSLILQKIWARLNFLWRTEGRTEGGADGRMRFNVSLFRERWGTTNYGIVAWIWKADWIRSGIQKWLPLLEWFLISFYKALENSYLFSHSRSCSSWACWNLSWFSWSLVSSSPSPDMSWIFFRTSSRNDRGSEHLCTIAVATRAAMQYRRNHAHLCASLQKLWESSVRSHARATRTWKIKGSNEMFLASIYWYQNF